MAEKEKEDMKAKKKAEELVEHEEKEMKNKKMKNELEAAKKKQNFESLKNAPLEAMQNETIRNDNYVIDKLSLGKSRYGSGN